MGFAVGIPASNGRDVEVMGIYASYERALLDLLSTRMKADPSSRASRMVIYRVHPRPEPVPVPVEQGYWLK
jgi:hypothetical protein